MAELGRDEDRFETTFISCVVDVGAKFLHQCFHNSKVTLLGRVIQGLIAFLVCLVDVASEIFDEAPSDIEISMKSLSAQLLGTDSDALPSPSP
jgi:hypothetical protein